MQERHASVAQEMPGVADLFRVAMVDLADIQLVPFLFSGSTKGALLRASATETYILYDERLSEEEALKVIAHELSHYLLHSRDFYLDRKRRIQEEKEAEALTQELLGKLVEPSRTAKSTTSGSSS
jgi:Zn-dependent peptidase ImmA (M78 family)